MQQKPIVDSKFLNFLELLPPLDLHQGPWISGGCARKLWCNQPWTTGDIDVWFVDEQQRLNWNCQLHRNCRGWQHNSAELIKVCDSDNATTYQILLPPKDNKWQTHCLLPEEQIGKFLLESIDPQTKPLVTHDEFCLQLIRARYVANLHQLWQDFDFTVCCVALDGTTLYADDAAVTDMHNNQLHVRNGIEHINLPLRILKYYAYGLDAEDELLLYTAQKISQGDWTWPVQY